MSTNIPQTNSTEEEQQPEKVIKYFPIYKILLKLNEIYI